MIYIVGIRELSGKGRIYKLFETNTESFFNGNSCDTLDLIKNHGLNIINAKVSNNEILIKDWFNSIHCERTGLHTGSDLILICKNDNNEYKLTCYDERIVSLHGSELKYYADGKKIANCLIANEKLKSVDTYTINNNTEFKAAIAEKYEKYVAKSALLGRKMSFNYIIEGEKVKLTRYTGETKNVIMPNFVTTIMSRAFYFRKLETITLNIGLKYIGHQAFGQCKLSEVIIPETVKFMGLDIFSKNDRLLKDGAYRKDRIKILSKNTTVLDLRENYL